MLCGGWRQIFIFWLATVPPGWVQAQVFGSFYLLYSSWELWSNSFFFCTSSRWIYVQKKGGRHKVKGTLDPTPKETDLWFLYSSSHFTKSIMFTQAHIRNGPSQEIWGHFPSRGIGWAGQMVLSKVHRLIYLRVVGDFKIKSQTLLLCSWNGLLRECRICPETES